MPSILFVCTANRFRSPFAAAILKQALGEKYPSSASWIVDSAGIWTEPGQPVIPAVAEVARSYGLDLSNHRSVGVSGQLLSEYDLILVMESGHKEALQSEYPSLGDRIYLLSNVVERGSYGIPDTMGSVQEVMEIGRDLNHLVRKGLERIWVLATALHNQKIR